MLPGSAVPRCCLVSFHFLWAIHPIRPVHNTVLVLRMAHRKWKETKQQPCTAGPGNMLGCISFYFLWAILSTSTNSQGDSILICQKIRSAPLKKETTSWYSSRHVVTLYTVLCQSHIVTALLAKCNIMVCLSPMITPILHEYFRRC